MRLERLHTFALGLPHTTVVKQWGECLVFKVAGKMFVILVLDGSVPDGVIFKCTPAEFDDLTAIDGIIQAPYCAKRMWAKVQDLAALPAAELEARIHRSYDLVAAGLPKKTQRTLGLLQADFVPAAPLNDRDRRGRSDAAAPRRGAPSVSGSATSSAAAAKAAPRSGRAGKSPRRG